MNKGLGLLAGACALAMTYPAASWYLGHRIQMKLEERTAALASGSVVHLLESSYRPGVFESVHTLALEFPGFRAITARRASGPLRLTIRTRIAHGPLPDLESIGAALATTEIMAPGFDIAARLRTRVNLDGSGVSHVDSPAFELAGPKHVRAAWEGVVARLEFAPGFSACQLKGQAPRIEFGDPNGTRATLAGMRFESSLHRIFADAPLMPSGPQHARVELLTLRGNDPAPVLLKRLSYDAELPLNGEFIDLIGRISAQGVDIAGAEFGPARYEAALTHLHARSAAQFYDLLPAAAGAAGLAPLSGPALAMLTRDPELRIERLDFRMPDGEASASATLRLNGVGPNDLERPESLLAKLDGEATVLLPETALSRIVVPDPADGPPETRPHSAQEAGIAAGFVRGLEALADPGGVQRTDGVVKARLAIRQGRLLINGQPVAGAHG